MRRIRCAGMWLLGFGVVQALPGQVARRPGRPVRPPPDPASLPIVVGSCPPSVPPSTANSVATAADYVQLQRLSCATAAETCATYTVRVGGDGTIAWTGDRGVEVRGRAAAAVDATVARALLQRLADRGFWGLCEVYTRRMNEAGDDGIVTTLSIAGYTRRVRDIHDSAPSWLRGLDEDIDRTLDTHRWRHGGPLTERFGDDHLGVDVLAPKAGVTTLMKTATQPDTKELAVMAADTSQDLNAGDSSGWTALMYAAQAGPAEAVAMLLKAGVRVDARSNAGETAMFAAVSSTLAAESKVRMLRAAGAEVNAADRDGGTPLMAVARLPRNWGLIGVLLSLGADPARRDATGRTALNYLDDVRGAAEEGARYTGARASLTPR